MLLSDAILQTEPDRRFAAYEVCRGRLPLWNPYNYCGVPFLANNNAAVFSPFMLPSYVWPGPEVIAWTQLLKALVAGIGAYCFFRRVLGVGFGPAAIGAWCYPHTGYLVLWGWIHHSGVVSWLPWVLLATDRTIRRPSGWGGPALALFTALTLLSGKMDTSGQVLLASGLFAVWCVFDRYGWRRLILKPSRAAVASLLGGWVLGSALAAPVVLPTYEYLQTSLRVAARREGQVDFKASGLAALPQVVLPYLYGSHRAGSQYLASGNRLESAALAYAGLLATLVLAPLGWTGRFRSINTFWCLAGFFALVPQLGVPVIREVYGLPGLNLLQNNRFAFFTAWCLLAMAVAGLDALWKREFLWRVWHFGAWVLVAGLGLWFAARVVWLPDSIATHTLPVTHAWFQRMYATAAVLCGAAAGAWLLLWANRVPQRALGVALGSLAVIELIYNAHGVLPQSDPSLYYPKLDVFERLASAPPGRMCGARANRAAPRFCLPANLARMHHLADIRGYDGADPAAIVRLLELANPRWKKAPHFAVTQSFQPVDSPILDMLNLRYRVFRGQPPEMAKVWMAEGDYWVVESATVLPRPFVPSAIAVVENQEAAIRGIGRGDFDPRAIAYVEESVDLPETQLQGTARIESEMPTEITIEVEMQTPALVVLADLWYPGWHATVNGAPADIVRTNGFLRGVVVPAGKGTIHLEYWPASFVWGLRLFGGVVVLLILWMVVGIAPGRTRSAQRTLRSAGDAALFSRADHLLQNDGKKSTSTVEISSRPSSMHRLSTPLAE